MVLVVLPCESRRTGKVLCGAAANAWLPRTIQVESAMFNSIQFTSTRTGIGLSSLVCHMEPVYLWLSRLRVELASSDQISCYHTIGHDSAPSSHRGSNRGSNSSHPCASSSNRGSNSSHRADIYHRCDSYHRCSTRCRSWAMRDLPAPFDDGRRRAASSGMHACVPQAMHHRLHWDDWESAQVLLSIQMFQGFNMYNLYITHYMCYTTQMHTYM